VTDERRADDAGADAALDALWDNAERAWDEDKPHQALLEYAITAQKLPELAGRYRRVKDGDPARAERAQKKLDGIVIAATQMLMAQKSPEGAPKPSRVLTAVVFIAFVAMGVWLLFVMLRHAR
jgi:hypothetical protein